MKTLNPKGGNSGYTPANLILPSIDANKLTLVGGSGNDYHNSGGASPHKVALNRLGIQGGAA